MFLIIACGHRQPRIVISPISAGSAQAVEKHLRQAAVPWLGTPHRLGGNDLAGIDCSGLVVAVYMQLFDLRLPRTTETQMQIGRSIDAGEVVSGDLLFFKLEGGNRHVGIYLGEDEFLHASKRRGVSIARFDSEYWRHHFHTARRILQFE